jgi:CBS-domain-containing membrane protein
MTPRPPQASTAREVGRVAYRRVGELMSAPGLGVRRETGLDEVARLLARHAVHAVAVVDEDGCPVGVVTGGDLRGEEDSERSGGASLPVLRAHRRGSDGLARRGREAATAADVMTSPAVTALPEWSLTEAVRTMERRQVKRLPVVNEAEQLIGFLSRSDVLRLHLRADGDIREEVMTEVLDRTLGLGPSQVRVTVTEGRVTLQGIVGHRDLLPVVDRLTRGVAGVVDVRNHLAHRTAAAPGAPPTGGSGTDAPRAPDTTHAADAPRAPGTQQNDDCRPGEPYTRRDGPPGPP